MIGQTVIIRGSRTVAHKLVDVAPQGAIMNIRPATRTNEQNAKMWAMLSDVARAKPQGRELTTDKWKALFMDDIGIPADWEPGINGGVVNVGYRSSRLSKEQMSDMIESMYSFGAEHGVEWSEPPAQGIEAATAGETVKHGSTEGESPVGLPMRPKLVREPPHDIK